MFVFGEILERTEDYSESIEGVNGSDVGLGIIEVDRTTVRTTNKALKQRAAP